MYSRDTPTTIEGCNNDFNNCMDAAFVNYLVDLGLCIVFGPGTPGHWICSFNATVIYGTLQSICRRNHANCLAENDQGEDY